MALRTLVLSSFRVHRVRVALTVAAISLSVSLVVAVTSGYASAQAAARSFVRQMMGSTDVQVQRQHGGAGGIDEKLLVELRADPDVELAIGRLETGKTPLDADLVGIDPRADVQAQALRMREGRWFESSRANEAVIDQVMAERLKVQVGGTIDLPWMDRKLTATVVGIVHKPAIVAQFLQTIYVPLGTLQDLLGSPGQVSRVLVDLRPGVDDEKFSQRWTSRLAEIDPLLMVTTARKTRRMMDEQMFVLRILSYWGGAVSMVAATFIIFSTLSMGVSERQRSLAMLRAIGTTRRQLAGIVVMEGVVLGALGAGVGVPLGLLWVRLLTWWFGDLLTAGMDIDPWGIVFAAGLSLVLSLLAGLLPAWSATRVDPLSAMTPLAQPPARGRILIAAACALPLIAVDSCIVFTGLIPREVKLFGHFLVGLPLLTLGFFLLAPAVVRTVEWAGGGALARLLRIGPALLRQQLGGGLWRSAGAAGALMVGLAMLTVLQTQGNTAMSGWRLPDRFPDMFIFAPTGVSEAQVEVIRRVKGIRGDQVLPIAVASPKFGTSIFGLAVGMKLMPDATMFFGVEPELALKMMELEFRQGTPADAVEKLKQGRHILVTEEFHQVEGLGIGDKLPLKTPLSGMVDYTIAGVIWSPGMDVFTSLSDMGRHFQERTVASIFGSFEDARRDFGVERVFLLAANLEPGVEREKLEESVGKELGLIGLRGGDVRQIKHRIQEGFRRLLLLISSVAFAAVAVASLGVTNTIVASVRTRRWQLGILRSIGLTGGQLLRLVLAEAILLGAVGCVLGLMAGLTMSVNASGMSRAMFGYAPGMDVPWGVVAIGAGIVMAVAVVAGLWPAATAARTQPLELLQAGRMAT